YETRDDTFPSNVKPLIVARIPNPPPPIYEMTPEDEPFAHLATNYYPFVFPTSIRRVTFQNFYNDLPDAHVWAIQKIGTWRDPEDWSQQLQKVFCRDIADQDVEELILIVTNTNLKDALPDHPKPRVLSESNGCPYLAGWAETSLHVKDDGQDVTYRSGRVALKFMPRAIQDQPGNVQYDLMPTSVNWTASGRKGDCTISGPASMSLGGALARPATGAAYMNVVGLDGGDFHSIVIIASPRGPIKKTCPGPTVLNDDVPTGVLVQL